MKINILLVTVAFYLSYTLASLFMKDSENVPIFTFIDVGQGDAILIEYSNIAVLVDGGPDLSVNSFIDFPKFFPICNFDYIFVSHPHADHLYGFTKLLKRCSFKKFFFNNFLHKSKLVSDFQKQFGTSKSIISKVQAGDSISIGDMTFHILWPDLGYQNLISQNPNNESIVILIDYHEFEILLTGDAEVEILDIILKNNKNTFSKVIDGKLDILKVPHHGASNGLHKGLYYFLNPKYCVISVGEGNTYGHPNQDTLDFFVKRSCEVLRTDNNGNIVFELE